MNTKIDTIKTARKFFLSIINELTIEELNQIPTGFNNNIIWNMAHLIAAQQGLCYLRSDLKLAVDEKYFTLYKSGTRPEGFIDTNEANTIKEIFITSIDKFQTDYTNNLFVIYTPLVTRYGIALNTIEDAINFLPFHEGLHFGCVNVLNTIITKMAKNK